MLEYKVDILDALRQAGYNTNRIRKEKLIAECVLQKFRDGQMVSTETIDKLCEILNCQPSDIIEYKNSPAK